MNDIIAGISGRLREAFPGSDGYVVYAEHAPQDSVKPYFTITNITSAEKQLLGSRRLIRNLFSVKYFPKNNDGPGTECNNVLDSLFTALQYITVGGELMQGANMGSKYADGALEFTVNYDYFTWLVPEHDLMESFSLTNKAKG